MVNARVQTVLKKLCLTLCLISASISVYAQEEGEGKPPAVTGGRPAPSKFEAAIKDSKRVEGLWTIYHKDQQILVELKPNQLNQDFLMLSSIARGVSTGMVIGGMYWGDDVLWSFRKVGDKIHVLKRNVRFKARPDSPEASAVRMAYSDSVMYALPIVTNSPTGGMLVDMTRVFLSDDEQIGRMLRAAFAMDRSTIAKVKAFPHNVEIDVNAVYASQDSSNEKVSDPRGMQVGVHYSISQLTSGGYRPRKADDRVGYFLVATKDFTDFSDDQHFVRYVTRWDLQKKDTSAKVSPPVKPIIFYLEKTVPVKLRPVVQDGIEEWNKAFLKLGFANAIQVRQQEEADEWDPEDVRYNTFRWITADAGFAIGPSRVNPMTGQILDADILFDAGFLRSWRVEYENFTPASIGMMNGEAPSPLDSNPLVSDRMRQMQCQMSHGMQHQMGLAAAMFALGGAGKGGVEKRGDLPEEYLEQALKEVVMHEVGHTLGLRHNFKASAWKTIAEMEDAAKANEPIVASVMDSSPVHIVPQGKTQTSYYTKTIGPYDDWAIEYGYKLISGDEAVELAKIAARSGEAGLDYATDEDTRGLDPDPFSNRFDLGKDPVEYARHQATAVNAMLPKVLERAVEPGDGYQRARQSFGILMNEHWRVLSFTSRMAGGVEVRRDHKGDKSDRMPFQLVPATQQREAMKLFAEMALTTPNLDPKLLNSLATSRWSHWGMRETSRIDYPVHDQIGMWQSNIISQMLSSTRLARLLDNEVKTPADQDAYTLAEHMDLVVKGCYQEILDFKPGEYTVRKPYTNSFRRNIQRFATDNLTSLVHADFARRDDSEALARMHLKTLLAKTKAILNEHGEKLDTYTKAHFADLHDTITQALEGKPAKLENGQFMLLGREQP